MTIQKFESTKFFSGIRASVFLDGSAREVLVAQADFEEHAIWDNRGCKYELENIKGFIEDLTTAYCRQR
jgi:hypothetical protein